MGEGGRRWEKVGEGGRGCVGGRRGCVRVFRSWERGWVRVGKVWEKVWERVCRGCVGWQKRVGEGGRRWERGVGGGVGGGRREWLKVGEGV